MKNLADLDAFETVLFDVDGTLIDSNAAHAETWAQALREDGVPATVDQIRALVGMGGDKLLPKVAGVTEDSPRGKALGQRKKALFKDRLPHLHATPGARELLEFLRDRGKQLVVATSADDQDMTALLKQAGVDDLFPKRTSKDDAAESKPDPDIVHAAMARAGARQETTVMVGDTPYDIESAGRAGVATIALRCGGPWSDADFQGAALIADDPADLLAQWRRSGADPVA
jgi:HAD superfamily hydrolase (TIGR01509 family)